MIIEKKESFEIFKEVISNLRSDLDIIESQLKLLCSVADMGNKDDYTNDIKFSIIYAMQNVEAAKSKLWEI